MARINHASLRAQLHDCRTQFEAIKQHGEASADTLALINALFMLVDIVVAVFLERTTPKTSRNSGLPSSRDGTDDGQTHTEGKSGSRSRGPKARLFVALSRGTPRGFDRIVPVTEFLG